MMINIEIVERILIGILFLIGLAGTASKKNIMKKIYALSVMNSAVVILFIVEGARIGKHTPIMTEHITDIVDPVPQAVMLTAIVIGVCITALSLTMAVVLFRKTGTFNFDSIRKRLEHDQ